MRRLLRVEPIIAAMVVGILAAAVAGSLMARPAAAHGSTQRPPSRYYSCRFENPTNPMCAAAWSANAQALYDWMEVNIGDAGGRHQELIPDGRLCSANRSKYAAFDAPGNWPVTNLRPDGSGLVDVAYTNTAPHSTGYYRFYLTREGFDARSDGLSWGDLELAYDSGPLAPSPEPRFRVPLPTRSTPAILYVIWQRNDSNEAFYACSDVTVGATSGSGAVAPPVTSVIAPSTVPASVPVTLPAPPDAVAPRATAAPPVSAAPSAPVAAPATTAASAPASLAGSASRQGTPATAGSPLAVAAPSATSARSVVVSAATSPASSAAGAAPELTATAGPQGGSASMPWTAAAVLAGAGLVGLTRRLVPPIRQLPARLRAERLERRGRRAGASW